MRHEYYSTHLVPQTICPHCAQGQPAFYACSGCSYLTLVCEETGELFKNPKSLDKGFVHTCAQCHGPTIEGFRPASSEAILQAGFTRTDYE